FDAFSLEGPDARAWAQAPTGYAPGGTLLVARDPAITTDDSANSVGTQIYDHGAPICARLVGYFQDTQEDTLMWPLPTNLQVKLLPGPGGTSHEDNVPAVGDALGAGNSSGFFG